MSSRWLVERRLSDTAERLKRLRGELAVVEEQLSALADAADDSRIRALVSETPLAEREHRENQRHADAMSHHRERLSAMILELQRSQDELLDRLSASNRAE